MAERTGLEFEFEHDARAFERSLKERLGSFGLEIEPTKTALLRFGDIAPILCKRDGLKRPRTFSFLGFTHYLRVWRNGRIVLSRKTEAARMRRKLMEFGRRLKSMRTAGARAMQRYTLQHWQGHLQYFGVSGNSRSVSSYAHHVKRLLFKVNVDASFPLEKATDAQEENRSGGTQDKIIINVVASEANKK